MSDLDARYRLSESVDTAVAIATKTLSPRDVALVLLYAAEAILEGDTIFESAVVTARRALTSMAAKGDDARTA